MAITKSGPATGSVLSGADRLLTIPTEMETNGTRVTNAATDTGTPRITLADAATQRVKWLWAIPVGWEAIDLDWLAINEVATSGNIKWQFAYRRMNLGEGDADGAVTTVTIAAAAAGGQLDLQYVSPSETAKILTPKGGLGDRPFVLCSLSRLGGDASDTLAGGVSVALAVGGRADP